MFNLLVDGTHVAQPMNKVAEKCNNNDTSNNVTNKSDKNEINAEEIALDNDVFHLLVDDMYTTQLENTILENYNNNDASIETSNTSNKNGINTEYTAFHNDNNINASFDVENY